MSISEIAEKSILDEEIADAITCLQDDSWTSAASNNLYPFRFELSTIGNILLRGNRLIIPTSLQEKVLELAHEGHPGESAMKRRLRSKKGKESADKKRGAKEIDIGVGDKVLIKNVVFPHKLIANFDPTEYDVIERKGNLAVVSSDGKRLTRNISHLKKIPIRSPSDSISNPDSFPQVTPPEDLTNTEQTEHQPATTAGMKLPSLDQGVKLKLIKKGGMWEPAAKSESDSGSNDVSADVND
ncbi:hypothetical protein KR026_002962 [Drosophila bipectinata]|nr:hypothetical protein KR026_002962 [Drosophila bipectinata]